MAKKLYEVEIKVYVMAENEVEAAQIAARECQPEEAEVFEAGSIASEWWNAIPYGADDDTLCGEIIKAVKAAEEAASE